MTAGLVPYIPAVFNIDPSLASTGRFREGQMARKLKTFVTSLGFFDQAIAAPSMKAALQAWGADSNLFHQGVAKQTDDPAIVAATMAAPGVILKRPVGSSGPFKEHADLPTHVGAPAGKRGKARVHRVHKGPKPSTDPAAERKAASAFATEERRRARQRAREEAVRDQERKRRQAAVAKAQRAFDAARGKHEQAAARIHVEMERLEARLKAEGDRWEKERSKLEAALERATR
jgi:hypothetical protein